MSPMQIACELNESAERLTHAAEHAEQLSRSENHIRIVELVKAAKELDEWVHTLPPLEEPDLPEVPDEMKPEVLPVKDDTSEVAGMNVHEAAEKISRMRSKDHLHHIIDTDSRKGVIDAATKRLAELSENK